MDVTVSPEENPVRKLYLSIDDYLFYDVSDELLCVDTFENLIKS